MDANFVHIVLLFLASTTGLAKTRNLSYYAVARVIFSREPVSGRWFIGAGHSHYLERCFRHWTPCQSAKTCYGVFVQDPLQNFLNVRVVLMTRICVRAAFLCASDTQKP
jgi:hypothetical protein